MFETQCDASFFESPAECMTQLIEAASNIPETKIHLNGRHEIHESGRVKCAGADILDEVFENIAKITIAQTVVDAAGHRAHVVEVAGLLPAIKAEELEKGIEAMPKIATCKDFVLAARVSKKVLVFAEDLWAEALELRMHSFGIFPEIDDDSIFKEIAPLRVDALEGHIVFESPAVSFEHRPKDLRKREYRRPEVKAESFGLQLIELAADVRVLLKKSHLEASASEHDGCGHAAEPSADDNHAFSMFGTAHDAGTKVTVMV